MEKRKRTSTEKMRVHKGLTGTSSAAEQGQIVCTPDKLRTHHIHIIGRSIGSKTTLAERITINDIKNGHGVGIIDPHSDMVEELLDVCLPSSQNDQAAK